MNDGDCGTSLCSSRVCVHQVEHTGSACCVWVQGLLTVNVNRTFTMETTSTAAAILEKKGNLEEELRRVERQIYELEGEYLQARAPARPQPLSLAISSS